MNKQIQSFPAYITKAEANGDQGIVEAFVSVMGNLDHHDDVITNGAFKKTIQERSHKIRVLDNHNAYSTEDAIAKLIAIKEVTRDQLPSDLIAEYPNATGALFVSFQFMLGDPSDKSARIFNRIKMGVIDEYSIGFEIIKKEYRDVETEAGSRTIRFITEIKLYEFSPVIFAANSATTTVGVKSDDPQEQSDSPSESPAHSKANGMCKGCKAYAGVTDSAGYCKMHDMAVEADYGCDSYEPKASAITMGNTIRESMKAFFAEQVAAYSGLGILNETDAERMATLSEVLVDTVLNLMPDDLLGRELPSEVLQLPKSNEVDAEAESEKNDPLTSVGDPVPGDHTDESQRRIAEIQRLKRISDIKALRR